MNKEVSQELSIEECQRVELEIMKEIHAFCLKHNLRYLLAYGTLIGAVRHGGFIPWDNDIDIIMPRPDYEKLLHMLRNKPICDHLYLLHYATDAKYHYQCARICDNRTETDISYIREQPKSMGVWVDIFPIDGIPDDPVAQVLTKARLGILKILQRSDIYAIEGVRGWKYVAKRMLRKVFPNKNNAYQRKLDTIASKTAFGKSDYAGNVTEYDSTYCKYVPADFDSPLLLFFEDQKFYAPKRYCEILTSEYGDYMKLPPIEQRMTHDLNAFWASPRSDSAVE